jgi:hypothetical protein
LEVFDDGGLHIGLTRHLPKEKVATRVATLLVDSKSQASNPKLSPSVPEGAAVEWSISPTDDAAELTLRFREGIPPPENDVPLAEDKNVSLERNGRSAIVGSDNEMNLQSMGRTFRLDNSGLEVNQVRYGTFRSLGLRLLEGSRQKIESLELRMSGQSNDIRLKSGGDVFQATSKPIDWQLITAAVGALAAAGYALLYALKEWPNLRKRYMKRHKGLPGVSVKRPTPSRKGHK